MSDTALLPPDLAQRSLSAREIVLALPDAERAIDHLGKSGRRLEAWAGWVKFPDGSRTTSLRVAELLQEAGVPDGFSFTYKNRGVPMPYEPLGVCLIDQWR